MRNRKSETFSFKGLKEIEITKIDELEELERSLNFVAIKDEFWGRANSIKEKLKLEKNNKKKIDELEKLETELEEMKQLKIEMIEDKSSKLLGDLNMEKRIEIEEIKEIEIKLEKLKIPKTNDIILF